MTDGRSHSSHQRIPKQRFSRHGLVEIESKIPFPGNLRIWISDEFANKWLEDSEEVDSRVVPTQIQTQIMSARMQR